mmetsp:Transcript_72485/g.167917  ORF Transcript_72485/g.167917 Transcript_72485/m.167917 type:complete len:498 (-) Transcript_72485:75-1568(-)
MADKVLPAWPAWAFLGLAVFLNLVLGSAAAFSFVKVGFYKYFTPCSATTVPNSTVVSAQEADTSSAKLGESWAPAEDWWGGSCWDEGSLSSLYSWAVFGGFICVPAGLLFDRCGPRTTTVYGIVLVNVGVLGMLALMGIGGTPPVIVVGIFYLLEEQGGPSALYMVAVCVLVRVFPKHLVGVISGAVAVAFGLSGLLWQKLAEIMFGFAHNAAAQDTNLLGLFVLLLVLTDICGVVMFFAAPPVFALQATPEAQDTEEVDATKQETVSIKQTLVSWNFLCLIALYSVVSAQVIGMSSYLSSIPTAFPDLSADVFAPISFVANVVGRVLYAVVVDTLTRYTERPGVCVGNIWMNFCYGLCFFVLAAISWAGEGPGSLVALAIALGYSAYGGGVCFASSFTKLSFPEAHVGIAIGLLFTLAAVASSLFSALFPMGNSQNSADIERVAADFVAPWTAGFAASLFALPVVVLVAVRALLQARCKRQEAKAAAPAEGAPSAI